MKKTLSLALVMIMAVSGAFAKGTAETKTVKGTNVTMTYTQPTDANGKPVFGNSQLTITKDCIIGGNKKSLKAGTYNVGIAAYGGEWTFRITKPGKAGAADEPVTATWAYTKHVETSSAALNITSNSDGLLMELGQTTVELPISFAN